MFLKSIAAAAAMASLLCTAGEITKTAEYWKMTPNALMSQAPGVSFPTGRFLNVITQVVPPKEFSLATEMASVPLTPELKKELWLNSKDLGKFHARTGRRAVGIEHEISTFRGGRIKRKYVGISRKNCNPWELLEPLILHYGLKSLPDGTGQEPAVRVLYQNCVITGSAYIAANPIDNRPLAGTYNLGFVDDLNSFHMLELPRVDWK